MGATITGRRSLAPRELAGAVVAGFGEHRLLTYASAIAFQVTIALPACLLFLLGVLGFLNLEEVWSKDIAPDVRGSVSPAAFSLVDDTVRHVLASKQVFWATAGAAIAVWEISGAVRASMGALHEIYGDGSKERPFHTRIPLSLVLAAGVGLCILGALVVVRFGPLLYEATGLAGAGLFALRWLLASLLLALAVGLLVHFAPREDQPLPWVSFGTLLVIVGWIGMSIAFAIYVTQIASYASIFGHLATFFVLLLYLYIAAVVFLGGLQLDAVVRRRVEGSSSGG